MRYGLSSKRLMEDPPLFIIVLFYAIAAIICFFIIKKIIIPKLKVLISRRIASEAVITAKRTSEEGYYLTFLLCNDEILDFKVPKEVYAHTWEKKKGTLIYKGNEFVSFTTML